MMRSSTLQEYGEEYFRTAESTVLKQLASYKNLVVVSCGASRVIGHSSRVELLAGWV